MRRYFRAKLEIDDWVWLSILGWQEGFVIQKYTRTRNEEFIFRKAEKHWRRSKYEGDGWGKTTLYRYLSKIEVVQEMNLLLLSFVD